MNKRVATAVLLILLGVILMINQTTSLDISFKGWWPLIIIIFAIFLTINRSITLVSGIFLSLLGVLLQLRVSDILITEDLLFPALLVLIGFWIIFSDFRGKKKPVIRDSLDNIVVFSALETRINSDDFTGGSISAIFAGADIDLRDAKLSAQGGRLDLTAVFGGIEVRLPEDWNVVVNGTPIFGGWENRTRPSPDPSQGPILHINCTAVFGGVEVKN